MHVERTFTVPQDIETVFAYLGDFTHTEQWDPGTVSTVRTAGDGGLGTVYRNASEFMGRQVELRYETITYEAPTRVQFRGTNKGSISTDSMTFTSLDDDSGGSGGAGGTRIHYRADFLFQGWLKYVAPLVVRRKIDDLADETIAQIRRSLP